MTMPTKPWVTYRPPDPEREYHAILSELPMKRFRDLRTFFGYSFRIQDQLREAPGLVGYSLIARIFGKQFWTLSVWEDEAALRSFVAQPPHSRAMVALQGKMGRTQFVQWTLCGSDYPPPWSEAFARGSPKDL
jgi:hypothetical protein